MSKSISPQAIIMMGAPASGKGTQARLIAERLGLFHLESAVLGQYFFKRYPNDPKVQEAKAAYDSGKLIPTRTFFEWIKARVIELHSQGQSIMFDGSPRTLYEAENLIPLAESLYGSPNIKAFYLKVRPEVAVKRSMTRRVCEKCGASIPFTEETKQLTLCPVNGCGGRLINKSLDTPALIQKRLAVYEQETMPAVRYLMDRGYLKEIDGEQSIETITNDIVKALGV